MLGAALLLLTPLELPSALGRALRHAMAEADAPRRALCVLLVGQLGLYLVLALVRLDFGALVGGFGLGYLLTRSAEALWAYCVLTLLSLPADAVALLALPPWGSMDAVELAAYSSLVAIVVLKGAGLLGIARLHAQGPAKVAAVQQL